MSRRRNNRKRRPVINARSATTENTARPALGGTSTSVLTGRSSWLAAEKKQKPIPRNATIDTLRGFAIVMMVADHALGLLLDQSIRDSPVRMAMRLAMPLFCVLMGYFLPRTRTWRTRRFAEIAATAVLVNLLFYPAYGCVDILSSLLVAGIVGVTCGRFFPFFVLAALFYPVDPTDGWPRGGPMDFPLSIVLSFVALGSLHARRGGRIACWAAAALTAFYLPATWLTPGSVSPLLFLFVLPASILLSVAQRYPMIAIPGLQWLGQNPLKSYAAQYYVIFALAAALGKLST